MSQPAEALPALSPGPARRDAFARATLLGWSGGLAATLAGLLLSFVLFGYAVVYWRNADMDFMVIYNALAMNDGKPQSFFDHTAYLTILAVKGWFRLLHAVGLLDAWTLSAIPSSSDRPRFDAAMTDAVRAGRVLAFLIVSTCVLLFAALARSLFRDWRVALLATLAFALSGGIAVHARILRTELIAAMPVILALMLLILAGRRARAGRPLLLGAAAALCVLGLENKVQAILLIAALPVVLLPFGSAASASQGVWTRTQPAWILAALSAVPAAIALWLAAPLLATGFDRALLDAANFRPLLLGRFGVYQTGLLALILGGMMTYAWIWRICAAETIASIGAITTAAALTLLLLNLDYDSRNVIAVLNPVEKMLTFADARTSAAAGGSSLLVTAVLLAEGLASALARYSFLLHSSPRPTVFLVWLIIPGIVVAWRRGRTQTAIQASLLMLAALGIDMLGVRRGLKAEYFIFTDPLIILAGGLLLDTMRDLRWARATYPITIILFVLHVTVGQADPVKHAFKRTGPEGVCEWNVHYMPLLPLPWCPLPASRP